MGLGDYNGEMRKGGRGGGGSVVFRSPGSKEVVPGEPGPYYDKVITWTVSQKSLTLSCFYLVNRASSLSPCSLSLSSTVPPLSHLFSFVKLCIRPCLLHPCCDRQTLPFTNQDGCLGEEVPCSPYSPPTVFKPSPLYNHPSPPRQVRLCHCLF